MFHHGHLKTRKMLKGFARLSWKRGKWEEFHSNFSPKDMSTCRVYYGNISLITRQDKYVLSSSRSHTHISHILTFLT